MHSSQFLCYDYILLHFTTLFGLILPYEYQVRNGRGLGVGRGGEEVGMVSPAPEIPAWYEVE